MLAATSRVRYSVLVTQLETFFIYTCPFLFPNGKRRVMKWQIQAKLRSSLSAQNLLSFHKQDGMSFKGWVNIMINGRTTTFICLHCKNTQQRPSSHSVVGFHVGVHLLSSFLWGWNELERNAVNTMSLIGRCFKPFPFEYMPQMSSTGSTCDLCPPPIGVRLVLKNKIG